jgi:hypothetical protein
LHIQKRVIDKALKICVRTEESNLIKWTNEEKNIICKFIIRLGRAEAVTGRNFEENLENLIIRIPF